MTPAELTALSEDIEALVRPFVSTIREDAPADARLVHASWCGFLHIEADGNPGS
ncbi:hypothetical protein [Actinokineospora inagensis]|uniref:hypothetical protein n=1 Tax=Actinokineospora inagensis TaxID=103730 RepID=UPI00041D81C0